MRVPFNILPTKSKKSRRQRKPVGSYKPRLEPLEDRTLPFGSPVVATLELVNDTGASSTDLVTTDPSVQGDITDDGSVAFVIIEFDYDDDDTADASTTTDEFGDFSHTPVGLSPGSITISARALEWDDLIFEYVPGDWTSLTFTLESAGNQDPIVASLALDNDTGTSSTDNVTTDPTLTGQVTDDVSAASLTVEFDYDDDGSADATTTTDSNGDFTYTAVGLDPGSITIEARAKEWDSSQSVFLYSDWVSISFTLEEEGNQPPEVDSLALDNDTGASSTDNVTTDPTVTGQVSDDVSAAGLTVEFDHDSDGVPDGTATTDGTGDFTYTPSGLLPGAITMKARAKEYDTETETYLYSSWLALNFTLENQPPVLTTLELASDTGVSDTDDVTTDPTLTGQVTDDLSAASLTVEFDYDNDGLADGSTTTDSSGTFSFTPQGLSLGIVTIDAWVVEWDNETMTDLYSTNNSITFSLESTSNLAPIVTDLALINDTGTDDADKVTADASISGQITDDTSVDSLSVEFDHDGTVLCGGTQTNRCNQPIIRLAA